MGPFKKRAPARVFVPPPPVIRTMPEITAPLLDAPPEVAYVFESEAALLIAWALPALPDVPPTPAPAVVKPKPPVTTVTAGETTPPPTERPKLSPIFTAAEVSDYNREIDQKLERVRGVLALAAGKNLTGAQKETVQQIRSLQALAEQARRQDLVTAVDYARRADLLANDLAGRLP